MILLRVAFAFLVFTGLLFTDAGAQETNAPALQAPAPAAGRERFLMDFGWHFALGNANDPKLDFGFGTFWPWLAKQNIQIGALGADFDDSKWRTVDLPHDWGMELSFDPKATVATWGCRTLGFSYPTTSIGWYRKTFTVPASDRGRRFRLEFEGVCHDCVVAVNGVYIGSHASAYTSFDFDVTDAIRYGEKNVIVVRVDARQNEGWWYQGAGIYRHVWLTKIAPVHVAPWGTQVISTVQGTQAQVTATSQVANDSGQAVDVIVEQNVVDDSGRVISTASGPAVNIAPGESRDVTTSITVPSVQLWSLDNPRMYKLVTTLHLGDQQTDLAETPFGIRTAVFDPDRGFLLNGQPVKIQGFCDHEHHAGVGTAVPDALWTWHLKRMKAMGCNAIRMSHNPAAPAFLDACDRVGMLVLAEQRLFSSGEEGLKQLDSMVRRDRNHPSIVLWSAGNEEFGFQSNDTGAAIMKTLQDRFHKLDPTRQVTFAASNGGTTTGINSVADVRGVNYLILFDASKLLPNDKKQPHDATPEIYHANHPHQPMIGTEETDLPDEAQPKDYKNQGREVHWKFIADHPWFAGAFIWTGFNYYGEDKWPSIGSKYGAMDLCGFPLSGYWFYRQAWTNQPPPAPVKAGEAKAIQFDLDRPMIAADGQDVDVVNINIVDAKSQLVDDADNTITFSISGPGKILWAGNGSPVSHAVGVSNHAMASQGHLQVLIQATKEVGKITLTVQAKGLTAQPLDIVTTPCTPPPSL